MNSLCLEFVCLHGSTFHLPTFACCHCHYLHYDRFHILPVILRSYVSVGKGVCVQYRPIRIYLIYNAHVVMFLTILLDQNK